jgi:predicted nucleic acid-binding protein
MFLLDTDVMVDVLRAYQPAVPWLRSVPPDEIALPGLVAMELLQGCRDRQEHERLEGTLRQMTLCFPSERDCARAFEDYAALHLVSGLGILDALIAQTALGAGVPLATFNGRHLEGISGLRVVAPYIRA